LSENLIFYLEVLSENGHDFLN